MLRIIYEISSFFFGKIIHSRIHKQQYVESTSDSFAIQNSKLIHLFALMHMRIFDVKKIKMALPMLIYKHTYVHICLIIQINICILN